MAVPTSSRASRICWAAGVVPVCGGVLVAGDADGDLQTGIRRGQHVPQDRVPLGGDHPGPVQYALTADAQIQRLLARPHPEPGLSQQHRQLSLRARRPNMLENDIPATATLGDLDLRSPGPARNLPNEHHEERANPPAGCVDQPTANVMTSENIEPKQRSADSGTSQEEFLPEAPVPLFRGHLDMRHYGA